MEKIYMNDNENSNNKKNGKCKKGILIGAIVAAVVVVFTFAITMFSDISFALPEEENGLGETFTSVAYEPKDLIYGSGFDTNTNAFAVNKFEASNEIGNIPVFCLERGTEYKNGITYGRKFIIDDSGLTYLMANLYPNVSFKNGQGQELSEEVQTWLAQSAIWVYLQENKDDGKYNELNNDLSDDDINIIKNATKIYDANNNELFFSEEKLYDYFGINTLLKSANSLKNTVLYDLIVSRKSNNVSLTSDGKYYQTDFFKVSGVVAHETIAEYKGYKVRINSAPEGTFIIDEEGNKIEDLDNTILTSDFAVRVPVENLTDENKDMKIEVSGLFDSFVVYKYAADGSQSVGVLEKLVDQDAFKPLYVEMNYTPTVPDTALDNTNTLFFIGIILLLSGLGIFYTSAKKN